jgi:hypothetical protein
LAIEKKDKGDEMSKLLNPTAEFEVDKKLSSTF